MTINRRDFMRNVGIASAATATACAYDPRTPTEQILPYVHQGDDVLPGAAVFYSTLCTGCANACGMVARAKDGRVTMVEGNPDHPHGPGLCTRGHFEVLAAYSPDRIAGPIDAGQATDWDAALGKIAAAVGAGKQVAWLGQYRTGSLATMLSEVPGLRRVHWEALGIESMMAATRQVFGAGFFPGYELADAKVIVSFGHDFLGTGFDSMRMSKGWSTAKDPAHGGFVTRFVAIEPRVGATSSQADNHFRPKPGTETSIALALAKLVAQANGYAGPASAVYGNVDVEAVKADSGLGDRLGAIAEWIAAAGKGGSVVLPGGTANAGVDSTALAVATLALNEVAGNIGTTVVLDRVSTPGRVSSYKDVQALLEDARAGKIGVLFVDGVDPVFNLPAGDKVAEALANVGLVVQFGDEPNDSTTEKTLLLPTGSALETWGDAQVTRGAWVLQQPAMNAPGGQKGMAIGDVLLALGKKLSWAPPAPVDGEAAPAATEAGDLAEVAAAPVDAALGALAAVVGGEAPAVDAQAAPVAGEPATLVPEQATVEGAAPAVVAEEPKVETPKGPVPMGFGFETFAAYVKERWRRHVAWRSGVADFDTFWTSALQRGGYFATSVGRVAGAPSFAAVTAAPATRGTGDMTLVVFPSTNLGDGRHANRPWAQELGDPITTYSWTTWAELNAKDVERLGLKKGDRVTVTSGSASITVGFFQSPGVNEGTVAVVLGNGRAQAGRYGTGRGANAVALLESAQDTLSGAFAYYGQKASVARADDKSDVYSYSGDGRPVGALNQDGRPLANVVAADTAAKDQAPEAEGTIESMLHGHVGRHVSVHHIPLDPRLEKAGLKDMFPTPEHPNYRFALVFDTNSCTGCNACVVACNLENNIPFVGPDQVRRGRTMSWIRMDRFWEGEGEHQDVRHLPALCQHCAHAPCEGVCPVLATYHNLDGLNAMIYNRCVGTRYCANNCPYTARRFNYHTWAWPESMHLMLNPDVSVREMGVMEKCTFCIQRTRSAKDAWRDVAFVEREDGKPVDVPKVPSDALAKLTACASACPTGAITFGNAKDEGGAVAKKIADPRAYTLLAELNTKPGVRYLARARHDHVPANAHHAAAGEGHAPAAEGHAPAAAGQEH